MACAITRVIKDSITHEINESLNCAWFDDKIRDAIKEIIHEDSKLIKLIVEEVKNG